MLKIEDFIDYDKKLNKNKQPIQMKFQWKVKKNPKLNIRVK